MIYKFFHILLILILSSLLIAEKDHTSLLVYGDSISAGYGMGDDKQWSEELKKILIEEKINIKIINKSLSGETTGGGLSRLKNIINSAQPSYILIELGGNDALRGYPPAKIKKNIKAMIQLAENNGVQALLMQIRILPNYGKRYQTSFESIYKEIAEENNIPLIPFMLNDIALEKKLMLDDGIHPNEQAQPLIASFIFQNLIPLINNLN